MKAFVGVCSAVCWPSFKIIKAGLGALVLTALVCGDGAAAQSRRWMPPAGAQQQVPSALSADMQLLLNEHNKARAKHCTAPLTWSAKVAADAQAKANSCAFYHNSAELGRLGEGENLYWGSGAYALAKASIDSWYGEIKNYNYSAPTWSGANGHFSQVVWKGSSQLGCGVRLCNMNGNMGAFWVCRYAPAGNINVGNPTSLRANVAPPCK